MSFDVVAYNHTVQKFLDSGTSFVTVTLIDVRGSAPQVVGAKALITAADLEWGTVGGGKIEAAAIRHAQMLLERDAAHPDFVVWNLQTDIGMTCGGEVKLFFEIHTRRGWPIVIYGAGHIAQSLIRLLLELNCHLTCIDTRKEWLDKLPDHFKLTKRHVEVPAETVATQPANAFFVLMSKGHATDLPVLAEILRTRKPPYLGVIGSQQKASVLKRDLKQQGFSDDQIASYFCPLGLPIGNNTPAEIAVSVAAQLIEQRDLQVSMIADVR